MKGPLCNTSSTTNTFTYLHMVFLFFWLYARTPFFNGTFTFLIKGQLNFFLTRTLFQQDIYITHQRTVHCFFHQEKNPPLFFPVGLLRFSSKDNSLFLILIQGQCTFFFSFTSFSKKRERMWMFSNGPFYSSFGGVLIWLMFTF